MKKSIRSCVAREDAFVGMSAIAAAPGSQAHLFAQSIMHRHDAIAEILAHRPEACLPMSRNLNSIGSRQLLPPKSPKSRPPYTGAARIGALPVGAMQNPARRNAANRNQKSACGCRVPIAFEMAAVSQLRANCGRP
jgi:hypothetical protein